MKKWDAMLVPPLCRAFCTFVLPLCANQQEIRKAGESSSDPTILLATQHYHFPPNERTPVQ